MTTICSTVSCVVASRRLRRFIDRGELTETDALDLTRRMTFAAGFRLMEEKVLFDERPRGPDVDRDLDFRADACEPWIRERKPRRGIPAQRPDRRHLWRTSVANRIAEGPAASVRAAPALVIPIVCDRTGACR